MTPEERAARAAAAMWASDEASKWLGMELGAVGEGHATLTLAVAPHHCNGHGTCHGGVIFALADSAFAFACNSRNLATVAQHAQVSFTAPARAGETLTAQAREVHQAGRNGIYDVRVTGPAGTVAEFRGMSRQVRGQLFEEET
ncbi:hydroxyphenylacetyl-CoA thioesterase PaaI [Jannaschia formosa]|uniref:hydroxyphenylacetyl-CoA thioesterase PaaI n=1 Tax=Jannaschia formosa TaxID=2259592 RepID=UPI000E1BF9CA|nr:hydroxyphenylacetyl-CoA thioesterase PaaI [Jannaschia formosa]TFL17699.1 hydroxyphenylacetyl-CoA thioesterase PaaI [Jannaschia formosa]